MALLSSSPLPFSLTFCQSSETRKTYLAIDRFTPAADLSQETAIFKVKENLELGVFFKCQLPEARFYMDGLETLPQSSLEEDDFGRPYLRSSAELQPIYSSEDSALIPGFYRIEVSISGHSYFALLNVEPRQLGIAEWQVMIEELDAELKGLAIELVKRSLGFTAMQGLTLSPQQLHHFLVMRDHFQSVMAALSDLFLRVNHRTTKRYVIVPASRATITDQVTMRHQLRNPDQNSTLLAPQAVIDYDLPENRWVKQLVNSLSKQLAEFFEVCDAQVIWARQELVQLSRYSHQANTRSMIRDKENGITVIRRYQADARKMANAFAMLRLAPWYGLVSDLPEWRLPQASTHDVRYHALYALHRDLQQESISVRLADSYSYQWKRSDYLYEFWCLIKLANRLVQSQGFEAVGGWVFGAEFNPKEMLIPIIPAGSSIRFERDGLELVLVYDQELPHRSQDTVVPAAPLYAQGTHNRPDARIDFYGDGLYLGSLICDFKYRPVHRIWDDAAIGSNQRPKVMNQLISYGSQLNSLHLLGGVSRWSGVRPVFEVWAFYPKGYDASPGAFYQDHNVRLLQLRPGSSLDHIDQNLERIIAIASERMLGSRKS